MSATKCVVRILSFEALLSVRSRRKNDPLIGFELESSFVDCPTVAFLTLLELIYRTTLNSMTDPAPPPAVIRRGRGTFNQTLRADGAASAPSASNPPPPAAPQESAPPSESAGRFAVLQRTSPPPEAQPTASNTANDTAREQLFRKDRRKRHIIFIGDAAEVLEQGFLRLYAHRGPKPLRLHHTPLRLLHLAMPHKETPMTATTDERVLEQGEPNAGEADGDKQVHPLSVGAAVTSTHKSNCLICSKYSSMCNFIRDEIISIWALDDVAPQRVSISIELGTAFLIATNRRAVHEDNFGRLVEKLNSDSYQLHFANDAPLNVLRAVDAVCGQSVNGNYAAVKMVLFSSDKQSRLTARAMWRNDNGAFELLDFEGVGITFAWTVLPLRLSHPLPDKCKKDVAFPFDVQFRAFHRSKQTMEHPSLPIVNAVLRELTEAEHNQAKHGGFRYDSLDFSTVFELNAASKDYVLESLVIEHTVQRRYKEVLVDSTESVLIEGFTAAQGGRSSIGAFLMRQMESSLPEAAQETSPANQRCSVARFCGSSVHWKLHHEKSHEDNMKPLATALELTSAIVAKANELMNDDHAGIAPEGL